VSLLDEGWITGEAAIAIRFSNLQLRTQGESGPGGPDGRWGLDFYHGKAHLATPRREFYFPLFIGDQAFASPSG
jgi:hypothetical protein